MRMPWLPTPEVVFNHMFINGRLSIFCAVALSLKGNLPLCYVFFLLTTHSKSDSMAFAVKLYDTTCYSAGMERNYSPSQRPYLIESNAFSLKNDIPKQKK